jgi:hypothetical protein
MPYNKLSGYSSSRGAVSMRESRAKRGITGHRPTSCALCLSPITQPQFCGIRKLCPTCSVSRKRYLQREAQKRYRVNPEHSTKAKALQLTAARIRQGELPRLPCSNCGSPNSHVHHRNYRKPLDITFLCVQCHLKLHGAETFNCRGLSNYDELLESEKAPNNAPDSETAQTTAQHDETR